MGKGLSDLWIANGGAVYVSAGTVSFTDCSFANNTATSIEISMMPFH